MTCNTCKGFGYLMTAPSTCSAGGERRSCPVCTPDAAASHQAIRAVTAEMRRFMPNACGDWADKIDAALGDNA